jgi:hypothetical protein
VYTGMLADARAVADIETTLYVNVVENAAEATALAASCTPDAAAELAVGPFPMVMEVVPAAAGMMITAPLVLNTPSAPEIGSEYSTHVRPSCERIMSEELGSTAMKFRPSKHNCH